MQPTATATRSTLTPVMTLKGHKGLVSHMSYTQDSKLMISGSMDKTVRRWDIHAGKEIKEAREVWTESINASDMVVSRDGRWVVTAASLGGVEANKVETRIVKTFERCKSTVSRIDISADNKLLAGRSSRQSVWIWSLDTGKRMAGPFSVGNEVDTIRFSPDSKKLAVNSGGGRCLEVWDVRRKNLDRRIGEEHDARQIQASVEWPPTAALVFGTTKGTIVASFTFTGSDAMTIYEFDAPTLQTVGTSFRGHTSFICSLALSFDCALLASASFDNTIKLWAFESRQLLASFDAQFPDIVLSPDSRRLAYTTRDSNDIFICNTPPDIITSIWPADVCTFHISILCVLKFTCRLLNLKSCPSPVKYRRYAFHLSLIYTTEPSLSLQSYRTSRPAAAPHKPTISSPNRPSRSSPITHKHQLTRHLHKFRRLFKSLLRGTRPLVQNDGPDPLDVCNVMLFPSRLT
jgi:WD40 repeat protein